MNRGARCASTFGSHRTFPMIGVASVNKLTATVVAVEVVVVLVMVEVVVGQDPQLWGQ